MTMRAVRFAEPGGAEVLRLRDVPTPTPRAHEVLVRVHAVGLNPKDALTRSRRFGGRASFPRGTGFDFAGDVVARGDAVRDLAHGERVWGFLDGVIGGTAAEFVAVDRRWLAPMPRTLDWVEAAALPLVASTALQALRDIARVRPGDRVLVKGASGGVGSAALQVAKALGAHTIAWTSAERTGTTSAHHLDQERERVREYVRGLGADEIVDAPTAAPERALRAACGDVLLDCAGGSAYRTHARLLSRGGRWVTVAPNLTVFALAPLSPLLTRLLGGPRLGFVIVRPRSADLQWLASLADRGALRMPIAAEFPLEEIVQAHRALTVRGALGKRVLRIIDDRAHHDHSRRNHAHVDRHAISPARVN